MTLDAGQLRLQAALEEFLGGEDSQRVEVLETFSAAGRQRLVEAVAVSLVGDLERGAERARSAEEDLARMVRQRAEQTVREPRRRPGERKAPAPRCGSARQNLKGRPRWETASRLPTKGRAGPRQTPARGKTARQSRRASRSAGSQWPHPTGCTSRTPGWGGSREGRQSRGIYRCIVACPRCQARPCNRPMEHSFDGHDGHYCKDCRRAVGR